MTKKISELLAKIGYQLVEIDRLKATITNKDAALEAIRIENDQLRFALQKIVRRKEIQTDNYLDMWMNAVNIAKGALGGEKDICKWELDAGFPSDLYETDCGNAVVFDEGEPKENGYRHCHYCGRPIVFVEE